MSAEEPGKKPVSEHGAHDGSSLSHVDNVLVGRENLGDVLPPHDTYEGRHRFDPKATWTRQEERQVVRKTDTYLLSWLCLMFFGLQLDRGNLSNALADNILGDLGLTTDGYNNGTTIQLVCFLAAEFPVQVLAKRYGFKYVLPSLMMAWGTVCKQDSGWFPAEAILTRITPANSLEPGVDSR